jgi:hypothetical protein
LQVKLHLCRFALCSKRFLDDRPRAAFCRERRKRFEDLAPVRLEQCQSRQAGTGPGAELLKPEKLNDPGLLLAITLKATPDCNKCMAVA